MYIWAFSSKKISDKYKSEAAIETNILQQKWVISS